MFTCPAIIPLEVNGFGWNLGRSENIVWRCPWQILGAIRAEARAGAHAEILFLFCQVSNMRFHRLPVGQISRNLYTICVPASAWILLEPIFDNLPVRGLFFQKPQKVRDHRQRLPTSSHAISPKWKQIAESHDRLARLWNVGFPYLPLESTQCHSPGQQAGHAKSTLSQKNTLLRRPYKATSRHAAWCWTL